MTLGEKLYHSMRAVLPHEPEVLVVDDSARVGAAEESRAAFRDASASLREVAVRVIIRVGGQPAALPPPAG